MGAKVLNSDNEDVKERVLSGKTSISAGYKELVRKRGKMIMIEEIRYEQDKFMKRLDDFDMKSLDYYKAFQKMCYAYNESSIVPYYILK